MTWSNQKPPGLDDIFDRHGSPHAIVGEAIAVVDDNAHLSLSNELGKSNATTAALYAHIPFCPSRCLSCDHLTIVEHDHKVMDRYLAHLHDELALMAGQARVPLQINRIHVGGGSPNYLDDVQLARLMASIHGAFDVTADANISMEINPRRTSRSQLDLIQGLGVQHLHLEVRDVDANVQNELGRTQSYSLLEDVFSVARDMKFATVNMDLVFGLPGQTSTSIKNSIAMIAELAPDMLVCQQYTRRPQQFPHQAALDDDAMPSLAEKLAIFNAVAVGLESEGYEWIGLNAFVRPGHALSEAQTNGTLRYSAFGYSENEVSQVLGAGLGAVSEVGDVVAQNFVDIDAWQIAIAQGRLATQVLIETSDFEVARRSVMRRLMCNSEVSISCVDQPDVLTLVESLESQGYTEQRDAFIYLTELGRMALPHFWSDSSPRFRWL
ncbi:MAG: radical SAM protein [Pseudomonadota bacterium]|nr:radical SAM protein [Pseudomonadota bacterium]